MNMYIYMLYMLPGFKDNFIQTFASSKLHIYYRYDLSSYYVGSSLSLKDTAVANLKSVDLNVAYTCSLGS